MSFATFSGPLRSGTVKEGAGMNTGLVVLTQSYDSGNLTGTTTGNYDVAAMVLPAGAQIISIFVDQVVAATTGTTTISAGTASGGAQLMAANAAAFGAAGVNSTLTPVLGIMQNYNIPYSADIQIWAAGLATTGTPTSGELYLSIYYVR